MPRDAFAAIRWARTVPAVRRADGLPDHVAHHVLLVLATYADREGRARPSLATLADEAYVADETARSALGRLRRAGLISPAGDHAGTPVWQLALTPRETVTGREQDARRRRARELAAARQRRYADRQRSGVTVSDTVSPDGLGHRHLTASDTVTPTTPDGLAHRQLTVPETVTNGSADRQVTVSRPSSSQVSTGVTAIGTTNELPFELPRADEAVPRRERASTTAYSAAFEAFWAAYGRKGAKRAAYTEWQRATKRANPDVIMARVGPYVAGTPEIRYRKDAERWLKGDCWESAIAPRGLGSSGQRVAYQSPVDQSEYDVSLRRSRTAR